MSVTDLVTDSGQAQDFRLPRRRIKNGGRAPAGEPAPRLAGVDDQGSARLPQIRFMSVSVNKDAGRMLGQEGFQPFMAVDEKKAFSRILEKIWLVSYLTQGAQDGLQSLPLAVAIAENGPHRAAGFLQLAGGEGSDEVTGMDDELAAVLPEQADRPAEGGQVVMRIRQYSDHALIFYLPAG
jgi:hypothetical protein